MTELVREVTGAVGEIVVIGEEMEVLSSGAEVGTPVVFRLVITVPCMFGLVVPNVGSIWAVPELVEVVITETLGVTVEVMMDPKNMPPVVVKVTGTSTTQPLVDGSPVLRILDGTAVTVGVSVTRSVIVTTDGELLPSRPLLRGTAAAANALRQVSHIEVLISKSSLCDFEFREGKYWGRRNN